MRWPNWVYIRRIRSGRMEDPKPGRYSRIRLPEPRKPWSWERMLKP